MSIHFYGRESCRISKFTIFFASRLFLSNSNPKEVQNENRPFITCRWVVTSQILNGISVAKARLVARGFENSEVKGRQILQRQNNYSF